MPYHFVVTVLAIVPSIILYLKAFCFKKGLFAYINSWIVEETKDNVRQEIFSERVKAGKRTYFFDVKATRSNDYYLTITESKRRYKEDGFTYEKHKLFLYKEDFDKFVKALSKSVDHVKNELLPDVDFDQFSRNNSDVNSTDVDDDTSSELKWD